MRTAQLYLLPTSAELVATAAKRFIALGYSIIFTRGRLRLVRHNRRTS